jgi:hypothetical protein
MRAIGIAMWFVAFLTSTRSFANPNDPPVCHQAGATIAECNDARGFAALERGDAARGTSAHAEYEAAANYFDRSYSDAPTGTRLALYGHAMFKAGHYDRAKKALEESRRQLRTDATRGRNVAAMERTVEDDLKDLRNSTVVVTLRYVRGTPPPGLHVSRKGEGTLEAPFAQPILMRGNGDTLVVEYPDAKSVEISIVAPPGTSVSKTIPAFAADTPLPAPPRRRISRGIGVGLLAAATVTFVTSGVVYARSKQTLDDQGCLEAPDGTLTGCRDTEVAQLAADHQTHSERGFVAGGVILVGGLVMILLDRSHNTTRRATSRLEVRPAPRGALLGYAWTF